jgi:hypothetical protein
MAAKVLDRIGNGRLPRVSLRKVMDRRTTPVAVDEDGMPCAVCERTILWEHLAYTDYPNPPSERGADLHFHYLCHEIWKREAALGTVRTSSACHHRHDLPRVAPRSESL